MSPTPVSPAHPLRALATLAFTILLASCGGGDGAGGTVALPAPVGNPAPAPPAVATPPPPAPGGSGRLTVRVVTPDDRVLPDATVWVSAGSFTASTQTDSTGTATLDRLPDRVLMSVNHPFGRFTQNAVPTDRNATQLVTVAISPARPVTMALLPVVVPSGGVGADRRSLLLQFTLMASPSASFQSSSYGSYAQGRPSPYVNLNDECWTWLDPWELVPSCKYPSQTIDAIAFNYDASGSGLAPPAAANTGSALLLVEQSQRTANYDPFNLRRLAAWNFFKSAPFSMEGLSFSTMAIATFPSSPGTAGWPLGSYTPVSATSVDPALELLTEPGVGPAPVLAALATASRLVAAQGVTGQRALVALLGGADDGGLSEAQRRNEMALMRQQLSEDGVRMVLVAGPLDANSDERGRLAEISAGLAAPLIFSGVPKDWMNWYGAGDGQYAALDLAARIVAGERLPTLGATFRLHAEPGATFVSGSTLRGTLRLESDYCPMGCAELPLAFEVQVP